MKTRTRIMISLGIFLMLFQPVQPAIAQDPEQQAASLLGTAFTYQGQLNASGGSPLSDPCDFNFALYDAAVDGTQIGTTQNASNVALANGTFTVSLDFGAGIFTGEARWLEIEVRCPAGLGDYSPLAPRQALTAVPYALYASTAPWSGLQGMPSLQRRVTGSCTVGSTIIAIQEDGSVLCEAHDARPGFSLTTLDSTGEVGTSTSITIGVDGLGLISYIDGTNSDLRVAHCLNTACSSATITTLDSTGYVGGNTSITIGADGLGLISYYDITNYDLKVAHCLDTACSSATITTPDSTGNGSQYTSITIGADGLGLISYFDVPTWT